jgi:hypothetical protein
MKKLNHIILIGLLALIPVATKAQAVLDQAINTFMSTQNENKSISVDMTNARDTLNGKHAFQYVCYSFTIKGKARKELQQLIAAFTGAQSKAYSMLVKPIGTNSDATSLTNLDGVMNNIQFGTHKDRNYHVLYIHDPSNRLYRYCYALVYGPLDKKSVDGQVYRIYSRDPWVSENNAQNQSGAALGNDNTRRIIIDKWLDGKVTINGNEFRGGFSQDANRKLRELQDSMSRMNEQMNRMGQQMQQLSKDPVKNSKRMNALGKKMNELGAKMNQLGTEMRQNSQSIDDSYRVLYNSVSGGDDEDSITKLNYRFGTYYNLYISGLENHKDATYLTGLANNLYALVEKAKGFPDKPELKPVWSSGISRLLQLESDTFRRRLLEAALKKLKN